MKFWTKPRTIGVVLLIAFTITQFSVYSIMIVPVIIVLWALEESGIFRDLNQR